MEQFFGGYLHQDWNAEFPDACSAVEGYVNAEPLEKRVAARAQLVELLKSCGGEKELSDAVDKVGLDYHPPGDGLTYREWLEKVERYLREHET